MANLITIARLILLFVVIAMIHYRPVDLALPSMILLGVVFALDQGRTFHDLIGELNNGTVRVGIHVQGFTGGGSESFVNCVKILPTLDKEIAATSRFDTDRSQHDQAITDLAIGVSGSGRWIW